VVYDLALFVNKSSESASLRATTQKLPANGFSFLTNQRGART
jgi:hypothetical protein